MLLRVPTYYKDFACIAEKCNYSCCAGWDVDLDEETADYYRSVKGAFGERLKSRMVKGEDGVHFALEKDGRCPFLNSENLCDIYIELGEEALSEVCTEFPRFTMEYENVREKMLSLACQEVGKLMFASSEKMTWEERNMPECCLCGEEECAESEEEPEEESEEEISADQLEAVRTEAVRILQDRRKPVFERAEEFLIYCSRMQQELFCEGAPSEWRENSEGIGQEISGMSEEERSAEAYRYFMLRMESFEKLDIIGQAWKEEKRKLYSACRESDYLTLISDYMKSVGKREYEYEHLLVYFTFRYLMRAYYDDNLFIKAQFAVYSVLMLRDMDAVRYHENGGKFDLKDRIDNAWMYSREVEHSEENMELLDEEFQFEDTYRLEQLLLQLRLR